MKVITVILINRIIVLKSSICIASYWKQAENCLAAWYPKLLLKCWINYAQCKRLKIIITEAVTASSHSLTWMFESWSSVWVHCLSFSQTLVTINEAVHAAELISYSLCLCLNEFKWTLQFCRTALLQRYLVNPKYSQITDDALFWGVEERLHIFNHLALFILGSHLSCSSVKTVYLFTYYIFFFSFLIN